MSRFIFFTKTNWSEPPRLRHQLALLLKDNGHDIVFFEKPDRFFKRKSNSTTRSIEGMKFLRTSEFIHHKLRVNIPLRASNAYVEQAYIKNATRDCDILSSDYIVNFNYEYYFLRKLFPNNRIVTVINDDFWCRALLGYEKPLKEALIQTCGASDVVLTVSEPLMEDLSQFCQPKLFLPWSASEYSQPNSTSKRNRLLFWGYINNRLNFDYIIKLADALRKTSPEIILDFVGPMQRNIDKRFVQLMSHPNVNVLHESRGIDSLNMDSVLASFIPYVMGNKADDVTTIPNKAFPMLAYGVPLLITGMPRFFDAPFVFRLGEDCMDKDIEIIKLMPELFTKLQPVISKFVSGNTGCERYMQFLSYL